MEAQVLDVEGFGKTRTGMKYPSIRLPVINETLPIIISALEEGSVPLIAEYNGQRRIVCNISLSAFNVDKLLRTQDVIIYEKDCGTSIECKSVKKFLEVV